MRRNTLCLGLGLLLVAGCRGGVGNLFSAHAKEAAAAGPISLTPESLAVTLAGLKGAQLAPETADFVANLWINYHLFALAVADGKIATDSAAVAEVMWPEVTERIAGEWHDTVVAHHANFTAHSIDSAYASSDSMALRLVQHILIQVPATAPDSVKAKARKKVEGLAAQIRAGANFGALALKFSGDPGSAKDSGYMQPAPRGAYVTSFDSAAWALAPGAVSGIVATPYGFHIVRRPPVNEIRDRFLAFLDQRAGMVLDQMYFDSLAKAKHLKVASKAPIKLRELLTDPESYRHSSEVFASYDGGKLEGREMVRWVNVLPPQIASGLGQATDSQISNFISRVAENVLFVQDAKAHGIKVSTADLETMRQAYIAGVDTLRAKMGLGDDLMNPATPLADREKAAALKVDQFLAYGFGARVGMTPIPAPMVDYLRDRFPSHVDQQGTARAVELALNIRAKAEMEQDSTARAHGKTPAPSPQNNNAAPVTLPTPPRPASK
ncbi:MAG TPA: peptidylprolyl isomerase [Gemmatimonadales bacterium]|nr:peptidylprolyl isomerase [Gemmatimonadales bacterium]